MKQKCLLLSSLLSLSCLPLPALATDTLAAAVAGGKTQLNLRLRHEQVDDEAFQRRAQATTLRARLTYTSLAWHGLSAGVEFDHVTAVGGGDRYNDTRNGATAFPQVPDPEGTDLNQAFLKYRQGGTEVTAGRQRINLDNQRFVGGVAWRQNEQTFDALRLTQQLPGPVQLDYAWVSKVHRIFGPDDGHPPAKLNSDHHLATLTWTVTPALRLSAYHFDLDFDDAPALSSRTSGVSAQGRWQPQEVVWDYRLDAARQRGDAVGALSAYRADYHLIALGATRAGIRVGLAQETLGANNGRAVSTPLATLHAFNGWADKFLHTPADGLRDRWVSVGGKYRDVQLMAAWHDYVADQGGARLGSEWNLQVARQFFKRYTLTAKYADYRADGFGRDTRKLWLMAEAAF